MGAANAASGPPARAGGRHWQETRRRSRRRAPRVPDGRHRSSACRDRARLPRGAPPLILLDSNVPMYLVGAAHPLKIDAQRIIERCLTERERLVTDAEVLQEILHRYVAIDRRDAIQAAFEALFGVVDEVFPVQRTNVERA